MAPFFRSFIAAGFGGQGVLTLGQLVAYTAMGEGRNVTWIPSYGPEMRGGTANCSVVLSDEEIGSPVVTEADVVVIMNQPSLEKFEKILKPGGGADLQRGSCALRKSPKGHHYSSRAR